MSYCLARNPLDRVDRDDRQDHANVSPNELPAMKRHLADIDRRTLEGARDYALLSVALLTGRRRAELVGVRWSNDLSSRPLLKRSLTTTHRRASLTFDKQDLLKVSNPHARSDHPRSGSERRQDPGDG
jgi:integrase